MHFMYFMPGPWPPLVLIHILGILGRSLIEGGWILLEVASKPHPSKREEHLQPIGEDKCELLY